MSYYRMRQQHKEDLGVNKTFLVILAILVAGLVTISFATGLNPFTWGPKERLGSGNSDEKACLLIDGFVMRILNLTMNDLLTFTPVTIYATQYCVDFPDSPVAKGHWTGVRLETLIQRAELAPGAAKVAFHSSDGFSTDLNLTDAARPDVIVAYNLDGEPLPEGIRLVVPGKWGYKWISMLNHIEIVNYDFKGSFEARGYSDEATI